MLNLKLFYKLQGGGVASLLLRPAAPGTISYFLVSMTVNYSIISSGTCEGELPSNESLVFDVSLDSIQPLLDKNHEFRLTYAENKLRFEEIHGRFHVEPLCVLHSSDFVADIVDRFLKFTREYANYSEATNIIEKIETELSFLSKSGTSYAENYLPSDVPFESNGPQVNEKQEILTKKLLKAKNLAKGMVPVDIESMRRIINAASRYNIVLSLCDDVAIAEFKTSYLMQKVACGSRAIQAKLLQRLLQDKNGKFYEWEEELVFLSIAGKDTAIDATVVFIQTYLANTQVSSSLVTKGAVLEKYRLNLKGILSDITPALSKFDTMVLNMGDHCCCLSNKSGEQLICNFDVEDAKTLELNKLMRGDSSAKVTMSNVEIPKELQPLLYLFNEEFTVYVKERKIILQSGSLYAIFSK